MVRQVNEDACLDLPENGLWVVADGMGGHAAGDYVSSLIVDSLRGIAVGRSLTNTSRRCKATCCGSTPPCVKKPPTVA